MEDIFQKISQADEIEIEDILKAVLQRCTDLFPDRDVSIISLEKCTDTNEQLDRIIEMLQGWKTTT